jgi:manganese oxidase
MKLLSRRDFLKVGGLAFITTAGATALTQNKHDHVHQDASNTHTSHTMQQGDHGDLPGTVGEVDHEKNGFNPTDLLTDFDYGEVSTLPNGQTLREYEIISFNKNIEVVPGIEFPAWTYNGRIPGPTIRATEGDRIRIHFSNGSNHPHSMHFHGLPAQADSSNRAALSPTSLTRSRLVSTSTIATSFRWHVTSQRDSTGHSSLIRKMDVRLSTASWSW